MSNAQALNDRGKQHPGMRSSQTKLDGSPSQPSMEEGHARCAKCQNGTNTLEEYAICRKCKAAAYDLNVSWNVDKVVRQAKCHDGSLPINSGSW